MTEIGGVLGCAESEFSQEYYPISEKRCFILPIRRIIMKLEAKQIATGSDSFSHYRSNAARGCRSASDHAGRSICMCICKEILNLLD